MSESPDIVVNIADAEEIESLTEEHWGQAYKVLTPSMRPRGGRLGVNVTRVPPGRSSCPFHSHQREDEVFFVMSGRGVLRYGEAVRELRAGDCVSCPAGTGIAHQLANPFAEDFVFMAIGLHDPEEVCVFPDSGKVMVRALGRVGWLNPVDYMEGEPSPPRILSMPRE